jgi:homoserine/homoserine lactone efflux protein
VSLLLVFALLELSLCLVPGPAVLFVAGTSMRRGLSAGLSAALGIVAGNLLYFGLSAAGIAALLLASHTAFAILRWCGAGYLAYVGVRALLARRPPALETGVPSEHRRAFGGGFVTQAANPKALIFFVAVLPQFIDLARPIAPQIVMLAAISSVIEMSVLAGYASAIDRVRRSAAGRRAALWLERLGGALLIGVAARVAYQ